MINLFDVDIPDGIRYSVTRRGKEEHPPNTYELKVSGLDCHVVQVVTFELINDSLLSQTFLQEMIDHMVAILDRQTFGSRQVQSTITTLQFKP